MIAIDGEANEYIAEEYAGGNGESEISGDILESLSRMVNRPTTAVIECEGSQGNNKFGKRRGCTVFGWFRKNRSQPPQASAEDYSVVQPRPQRCPLNAPGSFYTTGQCLACEAPEVEAPELLAPLTGGNYTTYFVRQPQSPLEVESACRAIGVCCMMDVRYGGTDRAIIERLGNDPTASDYVIRDGQLVRSDKAPVAEQSYAPSDLNKP